MFFLMAGEPVEINPIIGAGKVLLILLLNCILYVSVVEYPMTVILRHNHFLSFVIFQLF